MTKFALLVGINYFGTSAQLAGCINDIENIKELLISKFGYLEQNIVVLRDDNPDQKPTANRIVSELKNLVKKTHSGLNEIWFHYSGHGSYITDRSGEGSESDGRDECLVPCDYEESGMILDDMLNDIIKGIYVGCKSTFIMDCCHSGSMLDLAFHFNERNQLNKKSNKNIINAPVLLISGCLDQQTSADAYIENENQGAMTAALIYCLRKLDYKTTCFELIRSMRKYLKYNGYTQVPQLTSSKKLNNTSVFCVEGEVEKFISY